MGQLPLPASPGPSLPTSDPRLSATALIGSSPLQPLPRQASPTPSGNLAALDVLREALASGTQSWDSILQATTDAALTLAEADGVAIALRTKAEIICRARSGDIAPELGSPLNIDSGISGECLRSAIVLVCNDAETDRRVDPLVCRALGIRSIVVVPLRGQMGMAGVMSAFSARPDAFERGHIDLVRALAEIAEVVYDRERHAHNKNSSSATATTRHYLRFIRPQSEVAAQPSETAERGSIKNIFGARRWILAVSLIALLLLSISAVAWWSWHEPATADNSAARSTVQAAGSSAHASSDLLPAAQPKPNAAVNARRSDHVLSDRNSSDRGLSEGALKNAAELRPEDTEPSNHGTSPLTPVSGEAVPKREPAAPEDTPINPPPITVMASANPDGILGLTSEPAKLPIPGMVISQGVTEARLIHRVAPVYPLQALTYHVAGSVVLDATIGVDGSMRDVKVISGEPPLGEAAATAIRQWRYTPELLSGKPVEVREQITIVFKLPSAESR